LDTTGSDGALVLPGGRLRELAAGTELSLTHALPADPNVRRGHEERLGNAFRLFPALRDEIRCPQSAPLSRTGVDAFVDAEGSLHSHFCFLRDGRVSCNGSNWFGELGVPRSSVQLSSGWSSAGARTSAGSRRRSSP
jgi:hypothetical protein